MADKKIRLKKQKQDGTYDYLFPATKSSIVDVNGKMLDVVLAETDGKITENNEKSMKKSYVSVTDYGAIGDGVSDDSIAIQTAINTGKYVFFPAGKYLLTATISNKNLFLFGSGYEEVEIITTASVVFQNATIGTIKGLKFRSTTPLTGILFTNSLTFNCYVSKCYFQDYEYAFYYPNNGNGVRVKECYFRHGKVGLYLNYAHASSVLDSIFWQQLENSMIIERGTGGYAKGNSIVATNGKPSTIKIFSSTWSLENNYLESYPSTGDVVDSLITVEYNNVSSIPSFKDNLINGKGITTNGIKFVNLGLDSIVNKNLLLMHSNDISAVTTPINIDLHRFKDISILATPPEVTYPQMRGYTSIVADYTPITGTNTVPIDSGIVKDLFNLSLGNNTVKAHRSGVRYLIEVKGTMVTTVVGSGLQIKIRDVNGSIVKIFTVISQNIGEIPFSCYITDLSENNSSYRIETTSISGVTLPSTVNFFIELKEI